MNDDSPDPARLHADALAPVSNGRDGGHGGVFPDSPEAALDDTMAEDAGIEANGTDQAGVSQPLEETVAQSLRMAEALLFASAEALSTQELADRLPAGTDVPALLEELGALYQERGVNLVKVAGKWAFRTAADLSFLMERERVEQRRLSRAALETLAIVAYHQPVTRAEIEAIRGVTVSKGTLDVLMEAGWVKVRGRRQTPGRPVTYGTNDAFLEHFGLEAIGDLPGLEELKAAGLLDSRMPTNISVPTPSDTDEDDEDDEDDQDVMEAESDEVDPEEDDFDWDSFGADAEIGGESEAAAEERNPAVAAPHVDVEGQSDTEEFADVGGNGAEDGSAVSNGRSRGSEAGEPVEGERSDRDTELTDEVTPDAEDDLDHGRQVG